MMDEKYDRIVDIVQTHNIMSCRTNKHLYGTGCETRNSKNAKLCGEKTKWQYLQNKFMKSWSI